MTRRKLNLARADKRMNQLAFLRNVAEPRDAVRELYTIAAFYRGELDRMMNGEKSGFVERVESKRK